MDERLIDALHLALWMLVHSEIVLLGTLVFMAAVAVKGDTDPVAAPTAPLRTFVLREWYVALVFNASYLLYSIAPAFAERPSTYAVCNGLLIHGFLSLALSSPRVVRHRSDPSPVAGSGASAGDPARRGSAALEAAASMIGALYALLCYRVASDAPTAGERAASLILSCVAVAALTVSILGSGIVAAARSRGRTERLADVVPLLAAGAFLLMSVVVEFPSRPSASGMEDTRRYFFFAAFFATINASLIARFVPRLRKEAVARIGAARDREEELRGLPLFGLTAREREVARLLANGWSYKRIAEDLFVSLSTVRSHVEKVYGKVGVNNKVDLRIRMRGE